MRAVFFIGPLAFIGLASAVANAAGPTPAQKVACLDAVSKSQELRDKHALVEARDQLRLCAATQCPAAVRSDCANWLADDERALPTIIFAAKDASGSDTSDVRVKIDGNVLAERLEGIALAVNPGEHTFTFEAAGMPPVEKKFVVQEAQKDRRETIVFGAPAVTRDASLSSAAPLAAPPTIADGSSSGGLGAQRILAITSLGIGVAGIAVGTVFAAMYPSERDHAQTVCPNNCDQAGLDAWNTVSRTGTVLTVGYIVGGVGLAGAAALWFTAPRSRGGVTAQLRFGPGSVQIQGTW